MLAWFSASCLKCLGPSCLARWQARCVASSEAWHWFALNGVSLPPSLSHHLQPLSTLLKLEPERWMIENRPWHEYIHAGRRWPRGLWTMWPAVGVLGSFSGCWLQHWQQPSFFHAGCSSNRSLLLKQQRSVVAPEPVLVHVLLLKLWFCAWLSLFMRYIPVCVYCNVFMPVSWSAVLKLKGSDGLNKLQF